MRRHKPMKIYPNNWAVVVPLANEEAELPEFAAAMRAVMDMLDGGTVYLVVDEVSKDRTLECCRELQARDPRFITEWIPENRNVVDAYLNGFRRAMAGGHEIIIEMDGGLSHDPRAIPAFLRALNEGNDCAFGSRYINGGSMVDSPFRRRFLSKGGTVLARWLLGARLHDMTSGYQAFRRSVLEKVVAHPLRSKAHFYQTELRHLLRRQKWIEVPIHYRAPSPRVSRNAIRNSLAVLAYYWLRRVQGRSPHL
jgi:dolichol-phosphate mannosyltransferase